MSTSLPSHSDCRLADRALWPPVKLYQPLCDARHIRLLRLEAGAVHDDIVFEAFKASLNDFDPNETPQFAALSYAWGTSPADHSISCNGETFWVSRNLCNALRHIRWPDGPRIIWADAICINQSDLAEKNVQVPLMGEIYRRSLTAVWLGVPDESEDGGTVIALLKVLALAGSRTRDEDNNVIDDWERELIQALGDSGVTLQNALSLPWTAIYAFLCRPWFTRVWVNQEIALGHTTTAYVGNETIEVIALELAISTITTLEDMMMSVSHSPDQQELRSAWLDIRAEHRKDLIIAYNTVRSHSLLNRAPMLCRDGRIIRSVARCLARDPRDYIYGMISVLDDPHAHSVDYAKSVTEVYADFAWHCIKTYQNLLIFNDRSAQRGDVREQKSDTAHLLAEIPSWCPDWSSSRYDDARLLVGSGDPEQWTRGDWQASAGRPMRASRASATGVRVQGIQVDTVQTVSVEFPQISTLDPSPRELTQQESDAILDFGTFIVSVMPYVTGESAVDVARSILFLDWCLEDDFPMRSILGQYFPEDILAPSLDSLFSCWMNKYTRGHLTPLPLDISELPAACHGAIADRLMDNAYYCNRGTSLFATSLGYVGTATPDVRAGDLVCVLYGGTVPYVLRPRAAEGGFTFVGDCYVHGIMHGEAVTMQHADERDFLLI